jgi:hypothetical protein
MCAVLPDPVLLSAAVLKYDPAASLLNVGMDVTFTSNSAQAVVSTTRQHLGPVNGQHVGMRTTPAIPRAHSSLVCNSNT